MIEALFSHFCHQDPARSFRVGAEVLPFCHRCAGVYVGAVAAALFFASFGRRQRRSAPRALVLLNVLFVFAMGVFGFHVIETPPLGRYAVGVLFGSAVIVLAWPLVLERRSAGSPLPGWSKADALRYAAFLLAALTVPPPLVRLGARAAVPLLTGIGLVGLPLLLALPNLLLAQLLAGASRGRRRKAAVAGICSGLLVPEFFLLFAL